jgi:hypothetical protein
MSKIFLKDIKKAYISLWVIFSTAIFAIMISMFFLDEGNVYKISSIMQSSHEESCVFCGMTRSFVIILKGNFNQGALVNEAAFPLFSLLLLNQLLFISYLGLKLFKYKKNN